MANKITEQEIKARIEHLILMDNAIRNLNDEDLVMVWLAEGVPDMAVEQGDEDILRFMATYEDEFGSSYEGTVRLFNELIHASEEEE